jgi:hypothetical protein
MEISDRLEKARIYAYWGYAGIVCPVIGIIASGISISILNHSVIDAKDTDALEEQVHIKNVAYGALAVSIIIEIIMIIAITVSSVNIINTENRINSSYSAAASALQSTANSTPSY